MIIYHFLLIFIGTLYSTNNLYSAKIPVIYSGPNHKETIVFAEEDQLIKNMSKLLGTVSKSVTSQVSNKEIKVGKLKMSRFGVRIGVSGNIGLGPWSIAAGISQRMYFRR